MFFWEDVIIHIYRLELSISDKLYVEARSVRMKKGVNVND